MPPDSYTRIVSGHRRALQSAVVSAAPSAPKCSRPTRVIISSASSLCGNISLRQRRWAACMRAPGGDVPRGRMCVCTHACELRGDGTHPLAWRQASSFPQHRPSPSASSFPQHRTLSRLVRRARAETGRLGGRLVRARRVGLAGDAHLLRHALFGRLRRRAVRLVRARC